MKQSVSQGERERAYKEVRTERETAVKRPVSPLYNLFPVPRKIALATSQTEKQTPLRHRAQKKGRMACVDKVISSSEENFSVHKALSKGWKTRRLIRNKGKSTAAYFKGTGGNF